MSLISFIKDIETRQAKLFYSIKESVWSEAYQLGDEQILFKQRKPLMSIKNQKDINVFDIYIPRTANVVISELMKGKNYKQ